MKHEYPNLPAFLIFDAQYLKRFSFANQPVGSPVPKTVLRANSLPEIAGKLGIDGNALVQTVERFNGFARSGVDLDFHRGESVHEPDFHGPRREGNDLPNPMLFPLSERGPYHAVILAAGTYGTRGGPEIDVDARVLGAWGAPIAGLYGAGNCIASPAGGGYFGGGSQLGPGMVFGAIAGEHAARRASGSA
jgi:FAD binding domain-containing protein